MKRSGRRRNRSKANGELLDPETKKLFEELEKLLKENSDMTQIQKMLDKMNRKKSSGEGAGKDVGTFQTIEIRLQTRSGVSEIKEQREKTGGASGKDARINWREKG